MPSVNISTATAPGEFPAGTALGQMRFRLSGAGLLTYTVYSDVPLPPVVTFPNVGAGTYTLAIQRLSYAGAPVGSAYTAPLVVAAPAPVVGDTPVGAEVTVV